MPVSKFKSRAGRFFCGIVVAISFLGFAEPAGAGAGRKPSVLVLHTAWYGADTQGKLAATGVFGSVDLWDASVWGPGTPTLAQLLPYDAVLVAPDYSEALADSVALGNNLADYVDAGGGVVCSALAISAAQPLGGRWAPGYQVITAGANPQYLSPQTLDFTSITDPNNLLFVGVGSFSGSSSPRAAQTTVNSGCTVLARWTGGHVLAAASNTKARVDLNMFPPSSDMSSAYWNVSTDGAKLMANSLLSVIRPRVALVSSVQSWSYFEPFKTSLRNLQLFGRIDRFDAASSTPTLAQLSEYDAVLFWSDTPPANAAALGNVLADFVDRGGGLVASAHGATGATGPAGRWSSDQYPLFSFLSSTAFGTTTATFASHPITSGVSSFSTSAWTMTGPRDDSFEIAKIVNGVVSNVSILGSTRQPNRIDIGWDIGDAVPSAQITRLVANSLVYTAKPYVVCLATGSSEPLDVQAKLAASKRFSGVALLNVGTDNVSADILRPYSGTFFWSTAAANPGLNQVVGDHLATFVDRGGAVLQGMRALSDGSLRPEGNWSAQGYGIVPSGSFGSIIETQAGLGTVLDPASPIVTFVRKFDGGFHSTRPDATPLLRGRTVLTWSDGRMLASVHNFRKCVDLGLYPVSDSSVSGNWNHRTDGTWLMANALEYAVRHTPCPGDFNGDGQVDDADFVLFADRYNAYVDPRGDLTGDGNTDDADFVRFATSYNRLVCP